MVLRMESEAPPIKVQSWLRGQPLRSFQRGKVYIIEFWATWCEACVEAMAHLVRLQEEYRDRGLEVVGVAASEEAPTLDEARTKLDAWLTEKVPKLGYPIALDYSGEMNKLWMEPSSSLGIPTSYVVDRDGRIAFIGHPTELDSVLAKVLNGIWRTSDEAKAADTKRIAEGRRKLRETRKRALCEPILAKLTPAIKAEDWVTALSAVEEAVAVMPDDINFRLLHVDLLLHKMHDMRTGLPVMRRLVRDAISQKSEVWMAGVMGELFDPVKDNSYFPPAERFAMGKELSEHMLTLTPPQRGDGYKFMSYGAIAQYYYESGNKDRAIELIELALKSLDHPEPIQDEVKQLFVPRLLQALANYKGEKVCYGNFCSAPQNKSPEVPKRRRRRRKE
ncbi:TlpA family protein disulfide reductase [Bradyrhizobium sp. 157]|uniref:TlpA disulfide reductase family protein n=1 Tax=Bradyrhizobium sp. 157 TaxID=2782631 RepID=UPI001FF9C596|nr:TlpA disulfide reductase family protein [Bradyrhizobium sp. 157]MCK1641499.1 TlpA family protein disulfide reductase [Bradyrhizobium sp. 157]